MNWAALAPALRPHSPDGPQPEHADLACSVQRLVEDVLLDIVHWLYDRADSENLCLAGGVALNCVAPSTSALISVVTMS
ncbi:carbamoyltransferase N-terminal domain-containing protein, partial [Mycobacteroides abscessus subsp. massiliense]